VTAPSCRAAATSFSSCGVRLLAFAAVVAASSAEPATAAAVQTDHTPRERMTSSQISGSPAPADRPHSCYHPLRIKAQIAGPLQFLPLSSSLKSRQTHSERKVASAAMSPHEWQARVDLTVAYRLIAHTTEKNGHRARSRGPSSHGRLWPPSDKIFG
jgi:hypothetical protein